MVPHAICTRPGVRDCCWRGSAFAIILFAETVAAWRCDLHLATFILNFSDSLIRYFASDVDDGILTKTFELTDIDAVTEIIGKNIMLQKLGGY
jgi:hypothetical protein